MNFMSFNSEYESRQIYVNQTMKTLNHFRFFFDAIFKGAFFFASTTQKELQTVFNDLIQYDNSSSLSKHFFEFYRLFEVFLTKTRRISDKINYELVQPIELIHNHLEEKNTIALIELKEIITSVSEQKRKYEIAKHNYFDSCKRGEKQEAKVIQSLDRNDQDKNRDNIEEKENDEVEKQHDLLVEYRTIAEMNCQKYKEELKKTNDYYEEIENKYNQIAKGLRDNEESRKNFIKYHLEKLYSFIDDFQKSLSKMISSLKETIVEIDIEDDLKKYDFKYSYFNKDDSRISKENFLQYDIYRRNFEALINSNMKLFKTIPINSSINKISDININSSIIKSSQGYSFDEREERIIASLFNESIINKKEIALFQMKLKTKTFFAKDFIDKLLEKINNSVCIKVAHLDKLIVISECLSNAAINEGVIRELFELNYAIVHIAGNTLFQLPTGQKLYMTRVLSDLYPYFKSKNYWGKMLMLYLSSEINKTKNDIERNKERDKKKASMNINIYTMFNSNEDLKTILTNKQSNEIFLLIKDFIIHFSNFSVDPCDISDIFIETSNVYKLKPETLSLLIAISNSNSHSIKAKRYNSMVSKNKKVTNKHHILNNQTGLKQNFIQKTSFQNKNFYQCSIILNSLKYLNYKDYISILCLNHLYFDKASKYIYQSLLWDYPELSFDNRMVIWRNLVHYSSNTSYALIYESSLSYSSPLFEIIDVDIIRTSFVKDQNINRQKASNILKTLTYLHQDIGYCQGMSYICSFLITITNNEEKAFEIFNSLLTKTTYGKLVSDDFSLLKKYFYVYDRLLLILLPEVADFLKKRSLSASYYIAPWFITLFTNSFSYLPKVQTPVIVIRIFDLFYLNGWNAIINVGLCLMKHYEKIIVNMKFEELLHFLINDVVKYEFFHSTNYDLFVDMYNAIKVSSGLISNIENEYDREMKLFESKDNK